METRDEQIQRFEVTVKVKEMTHPSVGTANVVLKGSEDHVFATLNLQLFPHVARKVPFASKWRLVLEPVDDEVTQTPQLATDATEDEP